MKYQLRSSQSEGEVTLIPSTDRELGSCYEALVSSGQESVRRDILVSAGLVQVREEDGSLRRLAYSPDAFEVGFTKFFFNGRLRKVESVGGVAGRVEGIQSEGTVLAPMNGQVVKVPVNVGDRVECGEIVLILEAMKMENEVTAPIAGTLVELSVEAGQTVSPGQVLFLIEAIE